MGKLNEKLNTMEAARVLDVATRDGAFIGRLSNNLRRFDEIIGIDISEAGFGKAKEQFAGDDRIHFEVMDGCATNFPNQSFDLVCLSNSLHHVPDVPALLKEMKRLVKADGKILISEMPADGQAGASLTHALIHQLDSMVDTAQGIYHHPTYTRQEISDFIHDAGLTAVDVFEDTETIPSKNAAIEARVDKAFQKISQCKAFDEAQGMEAMARRIQENFRQYGANTAMQYIVFAR